MYMPRGSVGGLFIQAVTERFGQTLNMGSTYQNVRIDICLGAFNL
jgi:hypothetical protein